VARPDTRLGSKMQYLNRRGWEVEQIFFVWLGVYDPYTRSRLSKNASSLALEEVLERIDELRYTLAQISFLHKDIL
jgi:hypothetical protein